MDFVIFFNALSFNIHDALTSIAHLKALHHLLQIIRDWMFFSGDLRLLFKCRRCDWKYFRVYFRKKFGACSKVSHNVCPFLKSKIATPSCLYRCFRPYKFLASIRFFFFPSLDRYERSVPCKTYKPFPMLNIYNIHCEI